MTDTSLQGSLYEADIVTWSERQVAELRRPFDERPARWVVPHLDPARDSRYMSVHAR